jgi:hypothetical protein
MGLYAFLKKIVAKYAGRGHFHYRTLPSLCS